MSFELEVITPDWPAPSHVRAACTTRSGGVSEGAWSSLNLGAHVGDVEGHVLQNRHRLAGWAGIPIGRVAFLEQVHGTQVVELPILNSTQADACFSLVPRTPCLIMTADCLPVLFTNNDGTQVAAAHAGWRGLCEGVLEEVVSRFDDPSTVLAWLGPAIGPDRFEVGSEVRDAFIAKSPSAVTAFEPSVNEGRYMANIYELARQRLTAAGLVRSRIYGGRWCTATDSDRFFSYRRDGITGRMASLIFIE